jgi:hypothetical protein
LEPVARPQHLDQHGPLDVLLERFLELELLRPLGVETHGPHVDTGARDLQVVLDLDGLELHDATAAKPGENDVLRHLGMGPGGRTERARDGMAVEGHRQIPIREAGIEPPHRQIEDRLPLLQLADRAGDQRREGIGDQLGHCRGPWSKQHSRTVMKESG